MDDIFSDRVMDVPRSFIREILKVALDRSVISFAGGLPNRELFPIEELKQAIMIDPRAPFADEAKKLLRTIKP